MILLYTHTNSSIHMCLIHSNRLKFRSALLLLLLSFLASLAQQEFGSSHASSTTSPVRCHAAERDALVEFKRGLRDPSGRLSSWVGRDCCLWEGIDCSNTTGYVIHLDLRNEQRSDPQGECSDESYWVLDEYGCRWALFGGISRSLLSLQHLRHLDLSGNFFQHNPIPEFVGSFTWLTYLNLSAAGFKGKVPDQLGNLSKIHHLDLSDNFYNTDDDADLHYGLYIENAGWISQLTSLRHLSMDWVNLENASNLLPAMNMLPGIQKLKLANCETSVSFSSLKKSLIYVNFTSLTTLDLSSNHMNSSVPDWLFNITSLEQLYLGWNDLNWPEFTSISKLASLSALDLSANKFKSGFIPTPLSKLCRLQSLVLSQVPINKELINLEAVFSRSCLTLSLEELDLGFTQLSGPLPYWLASMKNIKLLVLSNNSLYGPLPASVETLSSLEYLDISCNHLNGTIAEGMFKNIKGLIHLGLGGRGNSLNLSGLLLANLPATLKYLDISYNTLLLDKSLDDWIPPFQLKYLYLSFCNILPPMSHFPKWLPTQKILVGLQLRDLGIKDAFPTWLPTTLKVLQLSHNEITGHVPQYLEKLQTLDLYNNSLSGQLPSYINKIMPVIAVLDLSSNNLTGGISFSVCQSKHLKVLRLFKNNFSGKLPNCWENSKKIITLDLSRNKFQGGIPSSLCSMKWLEALHLENNNLSGKIPTCLKDCARLMRLNLGYNNLSGNIPSWIEENLLDLRIFILRSNAFTGNISQQLSKLECLQILDFSNNHLSGVIPLSFGDFNGLKGNAINDCPNINIPYDGMWLFTKGSELEHPYLSSYDLSIDLSNNSLFGYIPKELGSLNLLQSLNLSYNYLGGEIPRNIDGMKQLEVLDLSRNNLSGVIPSSLAFLKYLDSLDLSYNNLSGRIPTGAQLQTFDQSSYVGNPDLCGFPLSNKCTDDKKPQKEDTSHKLETIWLFASIALGFISGFWTVIGALVFQRRWRFALFIAIDNTYDKVCA